MTDSIESAEHLHEEADERFAALVKELHAQCKDMDEVLFAGTISAILFKTGIKLAAHYGAPKNIVQLAVAQTIDDYFKAE
jgi:hypothetical protein